MVTPTKITAPSSEVRFNSRGAASSDSHLSSGLSDLDAQVSQAHAAPPEAGLQDTVPQKRTSDVWKFFTIETVDGYSVRRAVCKKCKQHFTKDGGTSHLRRHLNQHNIHARVSKKNQQRTEIAQTEAALPSVEVSLSASTGAREGSHSRKRPRSTQHKTFTFDQANCSHEMVKMIIQHDYPLDMVENHRFINFSSALQPRFKSGSINDIEEKISELYMTEKQNVLSILAGIPGRVSLSLDLLSDDRSFGYVILTGQFLDSDWKLQRRILSVIKLPSPDSEVALNHAVSSCLQDWGLKPKLFSLTLNNFSNEIVRQNLIGLLPFYNPRILNGQLINGSCYARALNDAAQTALASMDVLVQKVRKNVKHVVTMEANGVNLEIDDQAKWNTTYEMLVAASNLRKVYSHYALVPDYKEALSVEEWRKVDTLTVYLKLLHDAICVLHGGANPTADLFFHHAWKIQAELTNGASNPDPFVSNLILPLKECFDTYWKDCSLILAVAVVMDPRFKMKFIESCFSMIYGENAEEWIKMIDEGLHGLFDEYHWETLPPLPSKYEDILDASVANTETGIRSDNSLSYTTDDDFLDFDSYLAMIMGDPLSRSELDEYLDESLLGDVQDFDVLGWWKQNSTKYPILSRMASDILCVPVSNGLDQESVCDMAEKKIDRRRSGLKPRTIEALICLKNWLHFA